MKLKRQLALLGAAITTMVGLATPQATASQAASGIGTIQCASQIQTRADLECHVNRTLEALAADEATLVARHACPPVPPRGEFEKSDDYRTRLAKAGQACEEAKQQKLGLGLADVRAAYDADREVYQFMLVQPDGSLHLDAGGRAARKARSTDEGNSTWTCEVPVPIAEASALRNKLQLVALFTLSGAGGNRSAEWLLQDTEVIGVSVDPARLGGDGSLFFRIPLTQCRSSAKPAFALSPLPLTGIGMWESQGVTLPRLIREVKPKYTDDARRAKVQGSVWLECVVLLDGTVGDVRISESLHDGLDAEAVKAAKKWRFSPGTRLGQPVATVVTIEMTFTLRK